MEKGVNKDSDMEMTMEMEMERRTTFSVSPLGVLSATAIDKQRGSSNVEKDAREDTAMTRGPSSTSFSLSTSIGTSTREVAAAHDEHVDDRDSDNNDKQRQIRSPFHN